MPDPLAFQIADELSDVYDIAKVVSEHVAYRVGRRGRRRLVCERVEVVDEVSKYELAEVISGILQRRRTPSTTNPQTTAEKSGNVKA